MKTHALVFTAKNEVEVQEIQLPKLHDNEVLIDVHYSFVSPGTERWVLTGEFFYGQTCQSYSFPLVPGYQKTGVVIETGTSVKNFKKGDRVFATFNRFESPFCWWGGHSAMSVSREDNVYALPGEVDLKAASALTIMQVGFNGGSRPPVKPGDTALVIGDGLIGQFVAQTLRSRGAYVVIAGKGDKQRLEIAKKHSCDEVVDTDETCLENYLAERFPGGVNIAAEAIGIHDITRNAYKYIAYDGHFVLNGFYPHENNVDLNPYSLKEITVYNPASIIPARVLQTIRAAACGKIDSTGLITHTINGMQGDKAFKDLVLNKREFSLGVVFDWRS